MAVPIFFYDSSVFVEGETVLLSAEETRHATLSRRLSENDNVYLLDGKGCKAIGRFVELNKRVASVFIDQVETHLPEKHQRFIASAIPKGDRQKVMIDMLTQSGVSDFIPLDCEFSAVRPNDKLILKWQRIIREACKQSGNPFLMKVHCQQTVTELINSEQWQGKVCFRAEQSADDKFLPVSSDLLAVIGPEGGFSEQEIEQLDNAQAKKITLSDHILRTETAAIAAAIRLKSLNSV